MNNINSGVTRYYTKAEVAQILRVSVRTINHYMACGLPYMKIRRSVRIPEDKLRDWLQEKNSLFEATGSDEK